MGSPIAHIEREVYVLSKEERREIEKGVKSLEAGLGIPGQIVHEEMQEWLKSLKPK